MDVELGGNCLTASSLNLVPESPLYFIALLSKLAVSDAIYPLKCLLVIRPPPIVCELGYWSLRKQRW